MRVTARVKEATEKAIRAGARRLFVRRGLDGTSTREIAQAAGIAAGTLFNYFPSKEALAVSIAAEAFAAGRGQGRRRLDAPGAARPASAEEDLFALIACDIRALEPIRGFVAEVLEAGFSPFAAGAVSADASAIRIERLEDAGAALARHGLEGAATGPAMHLYWALYLGVLSFWCRDASPKQEDTWALLDQSVRMFVGGIRRASEGSRDAAPGPVSRSGPVDEEVSR